MNNGLHFLLTPAASVLLAATSGAVHATSVESFHLGFNNHYGHYSTTGSGGTALNVDATAYANIIDGGHRWNNVGSSYAEYASGHGVNLRYWNGSGLGVQLNPPGCCNIEQSPEHALDNYDAHEFILFHFDESIALKEAKIGWPNSHSWRDTDMVFMAYTGENIASGANQAVKDGFANGADALMGNLNSDAGDTSGTVGLTNGGWELFRVDNAPSDTLFDIGNTLGVESTKWLVGTQNQHLLTSLHQHIDHDADFAKLYALKGHIPGDHDVPEPASFALLGLGLVGVHRQRRRRR